MKSTAKDISDKIKDFRSRWHITEVESPKDEFRKFKTRVLNTYRDIDELVTPEGIKLFCQTLGIEEIWKYPVVRTNFTESYSKNIIDALQNEDNAKRFYLLFEITFSLPFKRETTFQYLFNELKDIIELSGVKLAKARKGENVILFPRGEKTLDVELIEKVLSFLDPKSSELFTEALKEYQNNSPRSYIRSTEALRRTIEEFLRHKFNNRKNLDNNIQLLQTKLKEAGRDPQIRNIIFQIFAYLDQYFNENTKHEDGEIDPDENEFLVYQVGLLLRYINNVVE